MTMTPIYDRLVEEIHQQQDNPDPEGDVTDPETGQAPEGTSDGD